MAIKRLHLINFRRHEDSTILFSDTAHLTLLAGRNGTGKSSVLSAIRYAIYGVGPTPKTRMDDMVRIGAELEGMTVELDFDHNGHEYSIVRHYEDGMSHASLSMDGTPVTQGPREVSKYMTQLWGMDVKGFDLATFATQKQLNGLTALSASRRAQTVSRLVRADVFTKARDDARATMNETKRLLQNLGEAPDVKDLTEARDARKLELDAALAAQNDAIAAAEALVKELQDKKHIQAQYEEAHAKKSRAEGELAAAERAVAAAEKALTEAEANLTERPSVPNVDIDELEDQLDAVTTRLTKAREAERAEADRNLLAAEVEKLTEQRDALKQQVEEHRGSTGAASAVVRAEQDLKALRKELEKIDDSGREMTSKKSVLEDRVATAREQLARLTSLDAVCPICEQSIDSDHKDDHIADAEKRIADLTQEISTLEGALLEARSNRDAKVEDIKAADAALVKARAQEANIAHAESQVAQLDRTIAMHQQRIAALPQAGEPVAQVAEERARLVADVQAVRSAERDLRAWEKQSNAVESARTYLERAKIEALAAKNTAEALEIPESLVEAVKELGELAEKLAAEQELASECTTFTAVAEQQLKAAEKALKDAESEQDRRGKLVQKAEHAEAAARLLTAAAKHMTNRIRPALEGTVSSILGVMSEGRLDAVKIDRDYNIRVRDDNTFRALNEMSGGEQDLVALALRLGLARVVSTAHGASGPEFLVLDEVFGSQDAGRRDSILSALQALKKAFPQILLVSHIDGAEDQVDQVIRLERIEADESTDSPASTLVTVE